MKIQIKIQLMQLRMSAECQNRKLKKCGGFVSGVLTKMAAVIIDIMNH